MAEYFQSVAGQLLVRAAETATSLIEDINHAVFEDTTQHMDTVAVSTDASASSGLSAEAGGRHEKLQSDPGHGTAAEELLARNANGLATINIKEPSMLRTPTPPTQAPTESCHAVKAQGSPRPAPGGGDDDAHHPGGDQGAPFEGRAPPVNNAQLEAEWDTQPEEACPPPHMMDSLMLRAAASLGVHLEGGSEEGGDDQDPWRQWADELGEHFGGVEVEGGMDVGAAESCKELGRGEGQRQADGYQATDTGCSRSSVSSWPWPTAGGLPQVQFHEEVEQLEEGAAGGGGASGGHQDVVGKDGVEDIAGRLVDEMVDDVVRMGDDGAAFQACLVDEADVGVTVEEMGPGGGALVEVAGDGGVCEAAAESCLLTEVVVEVDAGTGAVEAGGARLSGDICRVVVGDYVTIGEGVVIGRCEGAVVPEVVVGAPYQPLDAAADDVEEVVCQPLVEEMDDEEEVEVEEGAVPGCAYQPLDDMNWEEQAALPKELPEAMDSGAAAALLLGSFCGGTTLEGADVQVELAGDMAQLLDSFFANGGAAAVEGGPGVMVADGEGLRQLLDGFFMGGGGVQCGQEEVEQSVEDARDLGASFLSAAEGSDTPRYSQLRTSFISAADEAEAHALLSGCVWEEGGVATPGTAWVEEDAARWGGSRSDAEEVVVEGVVVDVAVGMVVDGEEGEGRVRAEAGAASGGLEAQLVDLGDDSASDVDCGGSTSTYHSTLPHFSDLGELSPAQSPSCLSTPPAACPGYPAFDIETPEYQEYQGCDVESPPCQEYQGCNVQFPQYQEHRGCNIEALEYQLHDAEAPRYQEYQPCDVECPEYQVYSKYQVYQPSDSDLSEDDDEGVDPPRGYRPLTDCSSTATPLSATLSLTPFTASTPLSLPPSSPPSVPQSPSASPLASPPPTIFTSQQLAGSPNPTTYICRYPVSPTSSQASTPPYALIPDTTPTTGEATPVSSPPSPPSYTPLPTSPTSSLPSTTSPTSTSPYTQLPSTPPSHPRLLSLNDFPDYYPPVIIPTLPMPTLRPIITSPSPFRRRSLPAAPTSPHTPPPRTLSQSSSVDDIITAILGPPIQEHLPATSPQSPPEAATPSPAPSTPHSPASPLPRTASPQLPAPVHMSASISDLVQFISAPPQDPTTSPPSPQPQSPHVAPLATNLQPSNNPAPEDNPQPNPFAIPPFWSPRYHLPSTTNPFRILLAPTLSEPIHPCPAPAALDPSPPQSPTSPIDTISATTQPAALAPPAPIPPLLRTLPPPTTPTSTRSNPPPSTLDMLIAMVNPPPSTPPASAPAAPHSAPTTPLSEPPNPMSMIRGLFSALADFAAPLSDSQNSSPDFPSPPRTPSPPPLTETPTTILFTRPTSITPLLHLADTCTPQPTISPPTTPPPASPTTPSPPPLPTFHKPLPPTSSPTRPLEGPPSPHLPPHPSTFQAPRRSFVERLYEAVSAAATAAAAAVEDLQQDATPSSIPHNPPVATSAPLADLDNITAAVDAGSNVRGLHAPPLLLLRRPFSPPDLGLTTPLLLPPRTPSPPILLPYTDQPASPTPTLLLPLPPLSPPRRTPDILYKLPLPSLSDDSHPHTPTLTFPTMLLGPPATAAPLIQPLSPFSPGAACLDAAVEAAVYLPLPGEQVAANLGGTDHDDPLVACPGGGGQHEPLAPYEEGIKVRDAELWDAVVAEETACLVPVSECDALVALSQAAPSAVVITEVAASGQAAALKDLDAAVVCKLACKQADSGGKVEAEGCALAAFGAGCRGQQDGGSVGQGLLEKRVEHLQMCPFAMMCAFNQVRNEGIRAEAVRGGLPSEKDVEAAAGALVAAVLAECGVEGCEKLVGVEVGGGEGAPVVGDSAAGGLEVLEGSEVLEGYEVCPGGVVPQWEEVDEDCQMCAVACLLPVQGEGTAAGSLADPMLEGAEQLLLGSECTQPLLGTDWSDDDSDAITETDGTEQGGEEAGQKEAGPEVAPRSRAAAILASELSADADLAGLMMSGFGADSVHSEDSRTSVGSCLEASTYLLLSYQDVGCGVGGGESAAGTPASLVSAPGCVEGAAGVMGAGLGDRDVEGLGMQLVGGTEGVVDAPGGIALMEVVQEVDVVMEVEGEGVCVLLPVSVGSEGGLVGAGGEGGEGLGEVEEWEEVVGGDEGLEGGLDEVKAAVVAAVCAGVMGEEEAGGAVAALAGRDEDSWVVI